MKPGSWPATLAALMIVTVPTLAETKPLKAAVEEVAKSLPVGAMVLAERAGATVEYSAAGRLEPQGTAPETAIFEIGSITKVFTGLLLAQAIIEGKVTLETTVADMMGA